MARFATPKEIGEIMRLLFQHCKSKDGTAVYDQGWDDTVIAKAVSAELEHHHVRRLRIANFGSCAGDFRTNKAATDAAQRIKLLEQRVSLIEAKLIAINGARQ